MTKHDKSVLAQPLPLPSSVEGLPEQALRVPTIFIKSSSKSQADECADPGRIAILASIVDLSGAFWNDWRAWRRRRRERLQFAREVALLDDRVILDSGLPLRSDETHSIVVGRFMAIPHGLQRMIASKEHDGRKAD